MNIAKYILILLCGGLTACRTQLIQTRDDSGNLVEKYRVNRRSRLPVGTYRLYLPNGQIGIERTFVKGKIEGEERIYYDNGQLEKIATYKNGVYEGNFIFYYPDGKLEQEGTYSDDRIVGKLKTYYRSGELKEIVTFEQGEENGDFIEYFANGNIKTEGGYKGGNFLDGLIKRYDEEGNLIQKSQCDKGDCIVTWQINPLAQPARDSL